MRELIFEDLRSIVETDTAPMVSIYLPKDGALDMKALGEKWKEALVKVENLLLKDYTKSFVNSFLESLWRSDCIHSLEHLDKGIIVFYSSTLQGYLRAQSSINDLVVVADSFHVKPLFRMRANERGFYLISISARAINIWLETGGRLHHLESLKNELPTEENTNKKTKMTPREFISHAANEVNKILSTNKLPVILAGVSEHLGYIKKFINHAIIIEESIVGNVEREKIEDLRYKCFELLVPYYQQKELKIVEELNQAIKKNQVITYIEDIAVSAAYGKIKKLFVVENRQLWGTINKETGEIFISPKQLNSHDDDILDDICQMVWGRGDEVVVLKEESNIKGFMAAAVVTDRSHLYDFEQAYSLPG